MEFWIEKYVTCTRKKRNNGKNRTVLSKKHGEKENDEYLGISEVDTIKKTDKRKSKKGVLQKNKILLEIKLL